MEEGYPQMTQIFQRSYLLSLFCVTADDFRREAPFRQRKTRTGMERFVKMDAT